MELFNKDADSIALPVLCDEVYIGLVRKSQLYKAISKAYALDIYGRRPTGSLLDPNAVQMNPELDIHSALTLLLQTDPLLETDSIAIVSNGKCHGIVAVSSLMMNISHYQSRLLEILEDPTARIRAEVHEAAQIQQG